MAGRTYTADNQLATGGSGPSVYDGNGNPTVYNFAQGYDVEGRLASEARAGGGAAFTAGYRADGLRAWKADGSGARTYYLYDGGEPVVELDSTGAVTAVNAFAPDGLVRRKAGGSWTYYAFDPQGSAAQRLDASGNVVSSSVYDAFGRASTAGSWDDPFGYDARWDYYRDRESEYYYCQNRYYDPVGRWVTRDPIGYEGGVNLYGYCGEGPVGADDPEGEGPYGMAWGIVGGVVGGLLFGPAGAIAGAALGAYGGSKLGDGESERRSINNAQWAMAGEGAGQAIAPLAEDIMACPTGVSDEEGGGVSTCFAAGTRVVMADGTAKSVEDVRPGDRVESRSDKADERGKIVTSTVEREFELHAPSTLLLRFQDGASVEATAVHPFFVLGKGFTPAGELKVGDRVAQDRDGKVAVLASVVRLGTPKPVYNLTVGGTHTYFVRAGNDDLWVHNGECGRPYHDFTGDAVEDVQIKPTGNRTGDRRAANRASGRKGGDTPEGHEWHHHTDQGRMQLIPRKIHRSIPHRGGWSIWGDPRNWP